MHLVLGKETIFNFLQTWPIYAERSREALHKVEVRYSNNYVFIKKEKLYAGKRTSSDTGNSEPPRCFNDMSSLPIPMSP